MILDVVLSIILISMAMLIKGISNVGDDKSEKENQ